MTAALAAPARALADEPEPALAAQPAPAPASEPAPLPAAAPAPAAAAEAPDTKEAESPRPLPQSVLAMVNHDVVLRLDNDLNVEGRLISANDDLFAIRRPHGETIRLPRHRVRGVHLVAAVAPPVATYTATAPDGEAGNAEENAAPAALLGRPRERSFGFGTAFGGGISSLGGVTSPALLLPTIELQVFLPREFSIDVTMPLLNIALSSALLHGLVVGGDLYFNVNAGTGRARFVAGPGIGFGYAQINGNSVTSVKVPAQLGFEVLNKKHTFGFKMVARPWLEIATGSSVNGVGGGLMGAFVFSGYGLSERVANRTED